MSKKKLLISVVFPILLVSIISYYVFKTQMSDHFADKIKVIFKVKYWWLIFASFLTSVWWIIETFIFKHNATIIERWKNYSFKDSFVVTMVGVFYMTVTPFSSGGHIFQVYFMKKQGFKTSESLLVIMMNFIMYTWAIIIVSLGFYVVMSGVFNAHVTGFSWLFWIGIGINIIQNVLLILITSWDSFHNFSIKLYKKLLNFINKFKKKNPINIEEKIDKLEEDLERYRSANQYIRKHISYFVTQISLNILRFLAYSLIPLFIALALNMHFKDSYDFAYKTSLLMGTSIFMLIIQTVVPTPGASGAAEVMFAIMWTVIFKDKLSAPIAMILWRLLTYYLHIFVSMPYTFIYQYKYSKQELVNDNEQSQEQETTKTANRSSD